jgi:hypothetical protein
LRARVTAGGRLLINQTERTKDVAAKSRVRDAKTAAETRATDHTVNTKVWKSAY